MFQNTFCRVIYSLYKWFKKDIIQVTNYKKRKVRIMDFLKFMDFFVVGVGLYVLYSVYIWKTTGKMKKGFLISGALNLDACKDLPGYIDFMSLKTGIFGVVVIIYGAIGLINTYLVELNDIIVMASTFVFWGCLIWYAVVSSKGAKKFF